jgi:DNA-binding winged helix-turn-helix (wHTH) protein
MSGCFRFGEFELDLAAYALRRDGERIKLERIPMEALILLVERPGVLVGRSQIQAALWGADVFVEHDSAINTAVRKVRHALDDHAEESRFIETVVGKGYRFIAPVERVRPDSPVRRNNIETPAPSSDGRRAFPRYCVTRGRQEFILDAGENLVGRDTDARVFVDHPSVSRRHARIAIGPRTAMLEDLKSRNGTFVDGRRVDGPAEIRHGAIIGLGPITLTFLVLSGPASTEPVSGSVGRRHSQHRITVRP